MMKDERQMMKDDDFKLLRGFADKQTNEQTNGQTFVIVELLLRLKILIQKTLHFEFLRIRQFLAPSKLKLTHSNIMCFLDFYMH